MHEVEKIFVFLITFTLTISGLPICQELSPVLHGLPTSQPIATDWEMLNKTSSVIGITAASPTLTQNCSHPSRSSLYLTRPNLDFLGVDTSWLPTACPGIFSLSPKILHALNPMELSWTPVLPRHSCLDFYIPRCPWVPRAHVISRNIFSSTFKSKKAIIVTTFAVKPPPTNVRNSNSL